MEGTPSPRRSSSRPIWLFAAGATVLVLGIALGAVLLLGEEESGAQTVQFQKPADPGRDPFTKPADVRGRKMVRLPSGASGPFGGTGSDLVCDRELLIRSLRARPDRLREWARVLGVSPTYRAVARYIRRLRPVTLTRDTRVTNHYFVDGRAVPYQAILAAGTAVLVDSDGRPVARCRCGNPLLDPIYIPTAKCLGCPPRYNPPPPCDDYTECWRRYPDPPPVIIVDRFPPEEEEGERPPPEERPPPDDSPRELECDPPRSQVEFERCRDAGRVPKQDTPPDTPASASFSPSSGPPGATYVLSVSGFAPNTALSITLTRPSGVTESYSIRTGPGGSGSRTFQSRPNDEPGTYSASVSGGGEQASASVTVVGS